MESALSLEQKGRIPSLDIMRLLCCVMVVAIHSGPFSEFGEDSIIFFLAHEVFVRLGVPFFFAVSGYFYVNRRWSQLIKGIIIPYTIWSALWSAIYAINYYRNDYSIQDYLLYIVKGYFVVGIEDYLWFIPALVISATIVTFFRNITPPQKQEKLFFALIFVLYVLGLLGMSYYKIGNQIPFINILINKEYYNIIRRILFMALPFFLSGMVLGMNKEKCEIILRNKKIILVSLFLCLIFFLLEICFVVRFSLQVSIVLTVFLLPMPALVIQTCVLYPCPSLSGFSRYAKFTSGFVYFSHVFVIYVFRIAALILGGISLGGTVCFLIGVIVPATISIFIYRRKFFKILV